MKLNKLRRRYDSSRKAIRRRRGLWVATFRIDHGRAPTRTEIAMFPTRYDPPASYMRLIRREGHT